MRLYPIVADRPSHFDLGFSHVSKGSLPSSASLAEFLPPVRNQGHEGSCSAFSGCTVMETLLRKYRGDETILSPAFLYEVEREIGGTLYQDTGARLIQTQYALHFVGVCPEADDPYTPEDFVREIDQKLLADAAEYRIRKGYKLSGLQDIKAAIASGLPVQLGIVVYESFESDEVAKTGLVPLPQPGEQCMGGHATAAFGYDDARGVLEVRNSWGEEWGDHGNFYLPYQFVRD